MTRPMLTESRIARWPQWIRGVGLLIGVLIAAASSAWAAQRPMRSKLHNFTNAPVVIKRTDVLLAETFSTPTQMATPGAHVRPSRIRYANRAGQLPTTGLLQGEMVCQNQVAQPVEAVELTVVLLDAFHQPMQPSGQNKNLVHQIVSQMPRRLEQRVTWEQDIGAMEVYEVAVMITRVRFADGSLWQAPEEEVIENF